MLWNELGLLKGLAAMSKVFCVRAEFGKFAHAFKNGGYVAIGWLDDRELGTLSPTDSNLLHEFYRQAYPKDVDMRRAQNVGQIARFLFDIGEGDIVITPSSQNERIYAGRVVGPYYYAKTPECPFYHRKKVEWCDEPLLRNTLSIPCQNTMKASLTVFNVRQASEILTVLGHIPDGTKESHKRRDVRDLVIERILELSSQEFEELIAEILPGLGFDDTTRVGRVGDRGIDVRGTLKIYDLATVDLTVQVKRYQQTRTINAKDIRDFRGAVPQNSQAAFVTTARFNKKAREEAVRQGFKRVGLVDGRQLIDILVEHYEELSQELKDKLRLRRTLVVE